MPALFQPTSGLNLWIPRHMFVHRISKTMYTCATRRHILLQHKNSGRYKKSRNKLPYFDLIMTKNHYLLLFLLLGRSYCLPEFLAWIMRHKCKFLANPSVTHVDEWIVGVPDWWRAAFQNTSFPSAILNPPYSLHALTVWFAISVRRLTDFSLHLRLRRAGELIHLVKLLDQFIPISRQKSTCI